MLRHFSAPNLTESNCCPLRLVPSVRRIASLIFMMRDKLRVNRESNNYNSVSYASLKRQEGYIRSMRRVALAAAFSLLGACANNETPPVQPDLSTFGMLTSQVLAKSCATSGCHVRPSATAAGGLSLSGSDAYASLVGATPTQLNARQDGLKRVRPGFPDS